MGTKGDTNRQRIVQAADELFYRRGYNQTSFSDIADITGIPRGNFYYYFKTKDEILNAVIDARVGQFQAMLTECDSACNDPRERLLDFVDMLDRSRSQVLDSGCPIGTLSSELAKDNPELQLKSRELFDLLRDWVSRQFAALGMSRPDDRAMDLLARMQGVSIMACAFRDSAFLDRSLKEIKSWLGSLTSN